MTTLIQRVRGVQLLVIFGIAASLGGFLPNAAAEDKPKFDAKAEAEQAKQEEDEQHAERAKGVTGKYQKRFIGTFLLLSGTDKDEQPNPDVIGTFFTSEEDKHPGRSYLVKVANKNPIIISAFQRYDGKHVMATGKLRNAEKYLIVMSVDETGVTQAATNRTPPGGI
jgi:hypothetical protein